MSNLSLLVDCKKIIRNSFPYQKNGYKTVRNSQKNGTITQKQHNKKLKSSQKKRINYHITLNCYNTSTSTIKVFFCTKKDFCYYDVSHFVNTLLTTDLAKDKSLLFGYSNPLTKEWTKLKKFMSQQNIGLLSNAKFIQQSIKFDLPSINKNIQMTDVQLQCIKRKIDFNQNTIYQQIEEMKREVFGVGLKVEEVDLRRFSIEVEVPKVMARVPGTIERIEKFVEQNSLDKAVDIYKQRVQKQGLQCSLPMLQYFICHHNDYIDVYHKLVQRSLYPTDQKYKQFMSWRPVNQWQIQIQLQNQSRDSFIQELKLNYTTILESRQARQELLLNVNQLLYFFVGLRYQLNQNSKRIDASDASTFTTGQLQKTITTLQQFITLINSKQLLTPLQLKNNKQSYQYFISKFHNIEKNIVTLQTQVNNYKEQLQQLQEERNKEVEKLMRLRRKVVEVKKIEERMLTELVGKEVKIVGEVNKLE